MRKIQWAQWDSIIKSEKYSSGQISDMTAEVGERIQATTIRGRFRQLGGRPGKKGQCDRYDLGGRVCAEEDCRKVFKPTHHHQVRCSPECKKKAQNRRSRERAQRMRQGEQGHKQAFHINDGQNREGKNWIKYCRDNPFYLAALYPKTDLPGAVADMRMRGAL